jgi:hypothetical protein
MVFSAKWFKIHVTDEPMNEWDFGDRKIRRIPQGVSNQLSLEEEADLLGHSIGFKKNTTKINRNDNVMKKSVTQSQGQFYTKHFHFKHWSAQFIVHDKIGISLGKRQFWVA